MAPAGWRAGTARGGLPRCPARGRKVGSRVHSAHTPAAKCGSISSHVRGGKRQRTIAIVFQDVFRASTSSAELQPSHTSCGPTATVSSELWRCWWGHSPHPQAPATQPPEPGLHQHREMELAFLLHAPQLQSRSALLLHPALLGISEMPRHEHTSSDNPPRRDAYVREGVIPAHGSK